MKSFKYITLVMALCFSITAMAQDDYRKAVENFVQKYGGGGVNSKQTTESLLPLAQEMGLSASDAEAKVKDFVDNKVTPALTDIMAEEFKKHLTLDELNSVVKEFDTPAGVTVSQHLARLSSQEASAGLEQVLMPAIQSIAFGGSPSAVETPNVSDSYKALFSTYYKVCNANSALTGALEGMKSAMGQMPGGGDIIEKLQKFFVDNGEALVMIQAKEVLTEADLAFLNKTFSTPAGQKAIKASCSATKEVMPKMISLMQEFVTGE